MSFLKKIGQIILQGLQIWTGFAPIISAVKPEYGGVVTTISKDLAEIGNVIIQAEAMGQALQLPGSQKLTAAAPYVTQIILNSTLLAGKQIADPQKFSQAVTNLTGAIADILNSVHEGAATAQSVIAPGAPPMTNAGNVPTNVPPGV